MIKISVKADALYKNLANTMKLVDDMRPVLRVIQGTPNDRNPDTMIGGLARTFITQGASIGKTWPNLTDKYAADKAKEYPGKSMLIRSGDLFNSLVNAGRGNVQILSKMKLEYGTMIPYAGFHQTGTKKMKARKFIAITEKQKQKWNILIGKYIAEVMNGNLEIGGAKK